MVACLHSVALLTLSWASSHRGPSPLSHSRVAQARPSSAFASAALSPPRSVSLDAWLEGFQNQTLASAVRSIFTSTRIIAHKIRTASCDSQCCFNTLDGGDDEEAIDLLANQVMFDELRASGAVATASSTEEPYEIPLDGAGFSVAFDPLDSTSSVNVNFAVGSSWGVWRGERLVNVSGRDMCAAGLITYGPRTAMMVATAEHDLVHEFVLSDASGSWEWLQSNTFVGMREDNPQQRAVFAPGNLRATQTNPGYKALVDYYLQQRYHLRYSGGMVPDVAQLIIKGLGIFAAADGGHESRARLRLLYEVAPAAYVIEKAGGASSDGAQSILDLTVRHTDQRVQAAMGSAGEVSRFESLVGPGRERR